MGKIGKGCFLFLVVAVFCPISNARNLVIGLPLLEPYAAQQEGEISGMYADILGAVFRRAGVGITMWVMPAARLCQEFRKGALDVMVLANCALMAPRIAHMAKEPLNVERMVLMESTNNLRAAEPSTRLINASVAAIRGFSPNLNNIDRKKITLVNSREQLLKMLFANRVDYIVAEENITSSFARRRDFPSLARVKLITHQPNIAAFSKLRLGEDAHSLGNQFDEALRRIKQSGQWRTILENYLEPSPKQAI